MPNGDHGPPYHSEQPLFSERLYADAKERIRLLELEVAEARRCPGCDAEAGTVHMGCVVCDQRARAWKAEAERDRLREALMLYADDIPRQHDPTIARAALADATKEG